MPKKRYISEDICFSTDTNSLSDFGERVFVRLISIADDYGVIPSDHTRLRRMSGFDESRQKDFIKAISELEKSNLLQRISYQFKEFLRLNPQRFDKEQNHLYRRSRSEIIGIKADTREEFESQIDVSKNFLEVLEKINSDVPERPPIVYSLKDKAESINKSAENFFLMELPESLLGLSGFNESWKEWVSHLKEKKKKPTEGAVKKQINFLALQPNPIACIDHAIRNNWQGLYEIKTNGNSDNGKQQSSYERRLNFDAKEAFRNTDEFISKLGEVTGNP